jgi:eukaryotic-like serine/threonine-protein kinase
MSLAPGQHLGPYEIVGLLGSGGMGEVYRASDPRLRRQVAIKILRRSPTDQEHVERFSREARAAGSLNHPNIVAVFDVGNEAGMPYVVTELLDGETLRARLDRGPLAFRKAIDYGVQIAQALAAAHARGIWHRDVKPANAFITTDGHVKLLDFGIAKLADREVWNESRDATRETGEASEIRGTVGYMAPEQVVGGPVDHRADIFALGAVLFEMFTGARAFSRPTAIETISAVLNEEPADPLTLNPSLPTAAAAIVRRCLEKSREERFQSARDLAFNLEQLRDRTAAVTPMTGVRRFLRRNLLLSIIGLALLAQAILLGMVLGREPDSPVFEQLTFRRGRIGGARFASEAHSVLYSEARDRTPLEVWRIDLADSPGSRSLGYPAGSDILAARAGKVALALRRRFLLGDRFVGTLGVASITGGTPHELTEIEDADWDPSGTKLAVAHSSGDGGGRSRLEFPPGTTLHTTAGSIRFVRVSPDGQRIAFLEDPSGRAVGGHVAVVDLSGTVTKLTDDWPSVRGLAWSPTGSEIWFTAGEARTTRAVRAVTLDGKQRKILAAPGSMTLWDIAPDGRVLLARDEERKAVVGVPPGETVERDLSWYDDAGVADLSSDGRWLLTGDRFGIYLRSTDGSPPTRFDLKDAFADDLSPDGNTVLATRGERLLLVPLRGAEPRVLPAHGITRYSGARWFPDGRRILVNGQQQDRPLRSYVQDLQGGAVTPVTPENTWALAISPDGEWAAAISEGKPVSLYPVGRGGAPRLVPGSEPRDRPVGWTADGKSLWLFRRGEVPAHVFQLDLTTGNRKLWKTLSPPDPAGVVSVVDFQITPKGHAYFYSYTQLLSQLYLVRGLK